MDLGILTAHLLAFKNQFQSEQRSPGGVIHERTASNAALPYNLSNDGILLAYSHETLQ